MGVKLPQFNISRGRILSQELGDAIRSINSQDWHSLAPSLVWREFQCFHWKEKKKKDLLCVHKSTLLGSGIFIQNPLVQWKTIGGGIKEVRDGTKLSPDLHGESAGKCRNALRMWKNKRVTGATLRTKSRGFFFSTLSNVKVSKRPITLQ